MDSQIERAEARVGTLLKGKWRLDQLVGVGGMAAVYAATHRNSKRVAVKMLHPELSFDKDIRQRFTREGYVANSVGHPGAVTVDDDDVAEDGSAFLVMELLEGETLDARMQRKGGMLPADEVLSLMDQVLDTLASAHVNGIVHRDLKPENIFLTRTGATKILDFGIARVRELSGNSSATQAGAMMGTPAFMPPEQAKSRWDEVDARTDLWAIGATMFTLLTGRFVHEAETVTEALAMAVMSPVRSLASVDPLLPAAVVSLVDTALARDKADRWQDATSMQQAVREAYHALSSGGAPAAHRLSLPDDSDIALGVSSPTAAPKVPTGTGVSSTLNRGAESAAPGLASPAAGASRRMLLVAIVAGVFVLVVMGFALRGGSGNGTVVTGATSAVPAPTETVATAAPPVRAAPEPEGLPLAPTPVVVPAPAAPELPAAESPKIDKTRATGLTTRVVEPQPVELVAPPPSRVKPAPVVLDDEPPPAKPAVPPPAVAPKPKAKPTGNPFTERF